MTIRDVIELIGAATGALGAIKLIITAIRFFGTLDNSVRELTAAVRRFEKQLETAVENFSTDLRDHEARLRVLEDRTDA